MTGVRLRMASPAEHAHLPEMPQVPGIRKIYPPEQNHFVFESEEGLFHA